MRRFYFVVAALGLGAPVAMAADGLVVAGSRIELGEIASAPEALRTLDVGPAPPPGGSVALDREHVLALVRAAGGDPQTVALSKVIRVVGASRHWTTAEVTSFVTPSIQNALPRGVALTHVEARIPLLSSPDAQVGRAEIPKPPKKAGLFRTGVVVPIVVDGTVVQRVSVTATFEVSDAAARPDVLRGSRVTLIIDRRSARIGAAGVALSDTDVGVVAEFRVEKTGRVVRARLDGTDIASVVFP
jgi:hypothetical protein